MKTWMKWELNLSHYPRTGRMKMPETEAQAVNVNVDKEVISMVIPSSSTQDEAVTFTTRPVLKTIGEGGVGKERSRLELMQENVLKEAIVFAVTLKHIELMASMGCKLNASQLQKAVTKKLVRIQFV